jgi:hypothetical protein
VLEIRMAAPQLLEQGNRAQPRCRLQQGNHLFFGKRSINPIFLS